MPEFKIEGEILRREARFRVLSWGAILLLLVTTVLLFVLGVSGDLSTSPNLRLLFVFTSLGTVIGACVLACRDALNYAARQMVFLLGSNEIVRKRQGYPDVKIAFSDIEALSEELTWLIIKSTEPPRKIAIPKKVTGYEVIRAELAKYHALSAQTRLPLRGVALLTVSILSWAAVVSIHDLRVVIPAGVLALLSLALASYRLWDTLRRGRGNRI